MECIYCIYLTPAFQGDVYCKLTFATVTLVAPEIPIATSGDSTIEIYKKNISSGD